MDKRDHKFKSPGDLKKDGWHCKHCGVIQYPRFYWYAGKTMKEKPSCPPTWSEINNE